MAIHRTRWSPDTCGCVVDYEWDDADPAEGRAFTLVGVVARCPAHGQLPPAGLWGQVRDENLRKNRVFGRVLEQPGLSKQGAADLADGIEYAWSFDDKRVLHVEVKGATPAQRQAVQRAADSDHGGGKVRVS